MKIFKVLKDVLVNGNTNRIWQILNKTPLIKLVSGARRLQYRSTETQRTQAFSKLGTPPANIQQALTQLRIQGYAPVNHLLSEEDLNRIDAFIVEKKQRAEKIKKSQVVTTKDFWIRLSDDDLTEGLNTENPLVKISLSENILKLASHYLGQIPFLEYVLLTLSVPSKKPLQSSQLWHLDRDNDRMVKFFVYLSDVNEDGDGPFTFIPADESKKVKNSFVLKHLPDNKVFGHIQKDSVTQMYGRKWTAFVCDTSRCYHMGSRLQEGHERLMLTSLYIALPSIYPTQGKAKIKASSPLSDLQTITITP